MAGYEALPDVYEWLIPDAKLTAGMVRRTQELAEEQSVPLQALRVAWGDLPDYLDPSRFDLVICVGDSLCHARGTSGRSAALAAMSRLLTARGRLVLTSRTWELVRAGGTRVDVRDRLVRRRGHDAVVIYSWQIEQLWEQEHHLEIAVARVEPDGTVLTNLERLSFWPYQVRGTRGGTAERWTGASGAHLRP